jgi:predicted DNA-binding transcriptional regulator YafY
MKPALILKTYFWLYDVIRNYGPLTLKRINEMWMADTRVNDGKPLIRQTFSRYRNDVEELFGVSIGCDSEHRYFIESNKLTEADNKASLLSSAEKDKLAEMMQFYHRIILEPNLSENIYFSIIVEAMRKNVMVEIDYQQDDDLIVFHQQVEPYCVKQHQSHWYLMGRNSDGSFSAFAFGKIREIRLTDLKFQLDYDNCVKLCERIADFS